MRSIFGYAAILFLALCGNGSVWAATLPSDQCNISGNASPQCSPTCTSAPFTVLTGNTVGGLMSGANQYDAARSDQGAAACPVDIWNALRESKSCRYVDNKSSPGVSIFVPFRTEVEWKAFLDNKPAYISIENCTRGLATSIPPDANCLPVPPATSVPPVQISLPYARWDQNTNSGAAPVTKTVFFNCLDTNGQPWAEQAQQTFTANDSDVYSPGWQGGPITYSSESSGNGQCGSDNNESFSFLSGTDPNLCNAGGTVSDFQEQPDAVGAPRWYWYCIASDGTSSPLCTANSWYCHNQSPQDGCAWLVCENRPYPPNTNYGVGPQWCVYKENGGGVSCRVTQCL